MEGAVRNAQRQDGVESLNLTDDGFRQWHPAGIRIMARRSLSANHPVNLLLYSTLLDVIKSNKKKKLIALRIALQQQCNTTPSKVEGRFQSRKRAKKRERRKKS